MLSYQVFVHLVNAHRIYYEPECKPTLPPNDKGLFPIEVITLFYKLTHEPSLKGMENFMTLSF